MPRYQMTAHFNEDELKQIDDVCLEKGWMKKGKPNHYVFLRTASLSYCETCEKEKKQVEQGRNPSRESPQTIDGTERTASGDTKSTSEPKLSLAEAVNHADTLDIGL